MTYEIDNNGNITMVQGDSIEITVNGIPEDKNYQVYLGVMDSERKPVGNQIMMESNYKPNVVLKLVGNFTNSFVVPDDQPSAKYKYAVKVCSVEDNTEDTVRIGSLEIGEFPVITVKPKGVEGI
jgi:hypothetical protein